MEIGKVANNVLKEIILDKLKHNRKEVIVRPSIGEDCSVIDFGEYACIMSSDPITGAVNDVGRLAVTVTCNDIASCGVEPLGILVTILVPPYATEKDLADVMNQIITTAASINVDVLGGHTEITSAVNRFVISSTAIGRTLKSNYVSTKGAKPGDKIVLTKSAGLEGTAIIAYDMEEELAKVLGEELMAEAKSFSDKISVVKEGLIAAELGVSAMHDVTEGGLLGAVWELCEASDVGAEIFFDKIPVARSTEIICKHYQADPLRLISSGCMLITVNNGSELVERLRNAGIPAAIIGNIKEYKDRILVKGDKKSIIQPPDSDELYRIIGKK